MSEVNPAAPAAVTPTPAPAVTPTPASTPAVTPTPAAAAPAVTPTAVVAPAPVVPEAYSFVAPEGITLDEGLVGKFSPVAKKLGFTQEQAQGVLDLKLQIDQEQEALRAAEQASWTEDLKKHPEIGGVNFETDIKAARALAVRVLGQEKAAALLALGDYPPLVQLLHAVARRTAEDTFGARPAATGHVVTTEEQELQSRYPTMPQFQQPRA